MKFINLIITFFSGLSLIAQGDMTMYFSTSVNPAYPNQIEVKLHSITSYNTGSSATFELQFPPMTSMGTFTPVLPGVALQGPNTYGSVSGLPAIAAGGSIVLARFTWITTAPSGTTGDFNVLDNANNYIEYGDPGAERQGQKHLAPAVCHLLLVPQLLFHPLCTNSKEVSLLLLYSHTIY